MLYLATITNFVKMGALYIYLKLFLFFHIKIFSNGFLTESRYQLSECRMAANFCECYEFGLSMTCQRVPMNELQSSFRETDLEFFMSIAIEPNVNDTSIPADLFGNNRILYQISLRCKGGENSYVSIDPNAFRSTANITRRFNICACNLHRFEFIF